ncbi:MAG: SDR family oxidoreductase [Pyrobaculum sp.]
MRVALITATGLLGSRLYRLLSARGFDVVPFSHSSGPYRRFDLESPDVDVLKSFRPDAVVISAAYTDVDRCEEEPARCLAVNCLGVAAVAKALPGAHVVYISTDYVFSGDRGMYAESDLPSPVQWYGVSKLCGERAAAAYASKWTVLRPSTLFGVGGSKLNFAMWAAGELSAGRKIRAYTDLYSSPTLADSLAEAVAEALERGVYGLFHFAGADRASRYQWALAIAKRLGAEGLVEPSSSAAASWRAKRPRDSSLSVEKARGVFKTRPLALDEAIDKFVEEFRRHALPHV